MLAKTLLLLVAFAAAAQLTACAPTPASAYNYAAEPDPRSQEFIIGVSDSLAIRVWKNPELSTDTRVRPDGTITMPLLGDIQAVGLTPQQLKGVVAKRLAQFVRDEGAVVTIAVTEINSYKVTVSGNVAQPGVFPSRAYLSVVEAIALAGGPNRFASPEKTVLMRRTNEGNIKRIPIDYESLSQGKKLEQNLYLRTGDTLFIP
ncbi:MAG TPA: polysaccharide biosynthesis/export family protein [Polyangiaceae bacterium]|nr:polysaccharide biosynthesis/export family protein [Polyangiaceae bacterium]